MSAVPKVAANALFQFGEENLQGQKDFVVTDFAYQAVMDHELVAVETEGGIETGMVWKRPLAHENLFQIEEAVLEVAHIHWKKLTGVVRQKPVLATVVHQDVFAQESAGNKMVVKYCADLGQQEGCMEQHAIEDLREKCLSVVEQPGEEMETGIEVSKGLEIQGPDAAMQEADGLIDPDLTKRGAEH